MELEEKKISSEEIYKGKILHLVKDEVLLPNGKRSHREYCRHIGAVCVIPLLDDGRVLMERQYRYAAGRVLLEIPAGKLETKDEEPLLAAARELREETGAVAGKYTYLGKMLGSPAILSEQVYMYLAEQLSFENTSPDDDEFIEIEKIPLEQLYEMVMSGEIEDSKTQIAVLKTRQLRENKKS